MRSWPRLASGFLCSPQSAQRKLATSPPVPKRSLVAARPGFFGVGILFYILASETIGFILCAFIILAASKQGRIRASVSTRLVASPFGPPVCAVYRLAVSRRRIGQFRARRQALQPLSQLPALLTRSGARVRGRSQVEVGQGRVHRPGAPAEPASEGPQDEREGAEQGTSRDSFRSRVGGLGGLLLGLVHRLTILLLILLNLSARLILGNVLRSG